MTFSGKIRAAVSMLKVRFFKRRIPLAVRFQLTNRCTSHCMYCNIWRTPSTEMDTSQVKGLLDQLSAAGTIVISFSGGEPLLREDIGEIIDYCRRLGIRPEINSTGSLVPKKIDRIKNLGLIKLSLDGPEEVHDQVRRKGSFREVMAAAEAAGQKGIKFTFATTLTRYNIGHTRFLLDTARRFDTIVAFQPLKRLYRGVTDMSSISPSKESYRAAISGLIEEKKKGNRHIRNSLVELEHIYQWPAYRKVRCWAGRLFCIIETDGVLYPCDRPDFKDTLPNCLELGFREALMRLPEVYCSGCGFCGTLELNLLMSFRLDVLGPIKRIMG